MSLQEKLKNFETILAQTPPEQQQEKLNELLATLSPQELEELQKQQCIICNIINKKTPAHIIYEDEHTTAALEINPASSGHTIIIPKKHSAILAGLTPDIISHLFLVANNIAQAQYDILEAEGTNIYVANGAAAGQKLPHAVINVIPRYEGDGISFEWPFGKPTQEDFKKITEKLKGKIETPQTLKQEEEKEEEEVEEEIKEEPKMRRRIP